MQLGWANTQPGLCKLHGTASGIRGLLVSLSRGRSRMRPKHRFAVWESSAKGSYHCTNGIYQFREYFEWVRRLFPEYPIHRFASPEKAISHDSYSWFHFIDAYGTIHKLRFHHNSWINYMDYWLEIQETTSHLIWNLKITCKGIVMPSRGTAKNEIRQMGHPAGEGGLFGIPTSQNLQKIYASNLKDRWMTLFK